jgi:hypothetical protein
LLPLLARSGYGRSRRTGGLAAFLALRHVGRRPGGTRATAVLATAVALATFGLASWSVGSVNRAKAADLGVGAPTVLTVEPPAGADLAATVTRIDPAGRTAAAVERVDEGGVVTLAVQPARFAAVADWNAAGVSDPGAVLARLPAAAPPPIALDGTAVRLAISVGRLRPAGSLLTADVVALGAGAPTPLQLGALTAGRTVTRQAALPTGHTQLVDLQLSPPVSTGAIPPVVTGSLTLTRVEVRRGGRWHRVAGTLAPTRWSVPAQTGTVAQDSGLLWSFTAPPDSAATLAVDDRPADLPAVSAAGVSAGTARFDAVGLDGGQLPVSVTDRITGVPGAVGGGVVVDLTLADRAAYGATQAAEPQVWVAGDPGPVEAGLRRAGFRVLSIASAGSRRSALDRQGPGLASVLYLADAAAAALLAAFGAVLGLVTAARRRRYEYAALATAGVRRRTLLAALAAEQVVVVGFGAVVGIAAGLAATALVERDVPEFVTAPAGIALGFAPHVMPLVPVLAVGVAVLCAVAAGSAWLLLRSIGIDRLRAGPA